jgi:hypothetical protein
MCVLSFVSFVSKGLSLERMLLWVYPLSSPPFVFILISYQYSKFHFKRLYPRVPDARGRTGQCTTARRAYGCQRFSMDALSHARMWTMHQISQINTLSLTLLSILSRSLGKKRHPSPAIKSRSGIRNCFTTDLMAPTSNGDSYMSTHYKCTPMVGPVSC